VKKLVLVVVLVLFVLSPAVVDALPWQCEWAVETGKLSDWLVCGAWLVIYQLQPGYGDGYWPEFG
jgi:hypothetical protein